MIIISNFPYEINEIINEYRENSVERHLLNSLSESNEKYQYKSLDQLKFELQLRNETVNAALELNNSDFSFAVFRKSECNKEYWDRTENGGFMLKHGVKSGDAINDIFLNGNKYATECATAMIIIYYKALLNIFSENYFNELFPEIYLMNWHSLDPLLKEVGKPKKVTDILIGDRGYFANPDVNPKTPQWQGENVIVLPNGMYYGHGIGIKTAEEIIYALNANRKNDATRSAYFMDSASRPNFKNLADIYYRSATHMANLHWRAFPTII